MTLVYDNVARIESGAHGFNQNLNICILIGYSLTNWHYVHAHCASHRHKFCVSHRTEHTEILQINNSGGLHLALGHSSACNKAQCVVLEKHSTFHNDFMTNYGRVNCA